MVENRTELYTSLAREKDRKLPSLLIDAEENPLVRVRTPHGKVNVKDVAFPTAREQTLVVPKQKGEALMGDVAATPTALLADTFRVAGDIAKYYQEQEGITQVDVMINYSTDPQKGIQTQPILHIHDIAWGKGDIHRPTNRVEMRNNPELRPQEREPLHAVIHDLLQHEVFPAVATDPAFSRLFHQIPDEHEAITYRLPQGVETFSDPDLARLIQAIHTKSQEVYASIAAAYFVRDSENKAFLETDGRYKLLPTQQRVENVERYIQEHPGFSQESKRWLHFLAVQATELETLVEEEQTKDQNRPEDKRKNLTRRDMINRFAAIKGLSYACVFSGIKKDDTYEWEFGFDPIVFSVRGGLQASRGVPKVGIRDTTMSYDEQTLAEIKASERKLGEHLLAQNQELSYEPGPQLLFHRFVPSAESVLQRELLERVHQPIVVREGADRYKLLDTVADIPGIEIVERAEVYRGTGMNCAPYTFGIMQHEPWAQLRKNEQYDGSFGDQPYHSVPEAFWQDTTSFLTHHGYTMVTDPQEGDVIAYRRSEDQSGRFQHFGSYQHDGTVISKPGTGHVLKHGIWQVPMSAGDEFMIFRKVGGDVSLH